MIIFKFTSKVKSVSFIKFKYHDEKNPFPYPYHIAYS